jgi:hypothetical protein
MRLRRLHTSSRSPHRAATQVAAQGNETLDQADSQKDDELQHEQFTLDERPTNI